MIEAIAIVMAVLLGVGISYAISRTQPVVHVPDSAVLADFAKRKEAALSSAKADNEKQLSKKEIVDSLRDLAS